MKLFFSHIIAFVLLVSCNKNDIKITTNFKSKKISEYINSSELDIINENWVGMDSLFLTELKEILKIDEKNIIDILNINKKEKRTKLGFGYEQIEGSFGKGYISIFYNLILEQQQVISYELTPQLPRNKNLTERYLKLFTGIFKIENESIYNRYYNIEEMERSLYNINSKISLNENLRFLMTPFSGIRYGFYGGYSGGIFNNRAIFLAESKNMNSEICQILMHSKNPATRIMAIEYYMKNKSNLGESNIINNWIEKIYSELPTIKTLEGCFVVQRNTKDLVSKYVKEK